MATITNPNEYSISTHNQKTNVATADFWADLEKHRFGYIGLILVVMACMGGLAAAVAVQESEIKLMAVALSTMLIEVLVMAVAPMRIILLATAVAFLINVMTFII